MKRNIYLASSWRNPHYPAVLERLRCAGHQVYDFRNPEAGDAGFSWREIDPDWQAWTRDQYVAALGHPAAARGYGFDKGALDWCDTLVLVLPCGRSAHLEAGYAIGAGKPTVVVWPDALTEEPEPELMYLLADKLATSEASLLDALASSLPVRAGRVVSEVVAERRRQVEAEGFTPEHDDDHVDGELAFAAAAYAEHAAQFDDGARGKFADLIDLVQPARWPWSVYWWKPKTRRSDLVRAAALLVAEIERLDRGGA